MMLTAASLSVIFLSAIECQEDQLLVQTADGPLRGGFRETGTGTLFRSFQAVPFAAPPVGSLRFGAPQPVEPWTEERKASGWEDIKCVQYGFLYDEDPQVQGSEDCLYLSVFTPVNVTAGAKLPVMFWIFGGYFQSGNNAWWAYGADNYIERDVILVQPNHRLGPFGFTDMGIPEAPGNQALRDLVAALQWVNTNIENFGGDKDRVTIFGESSGSWAVSYLQMTPYASGLYHRAIMQSGGLFNPFWLWQTREDAVSLSSVLATIYNCTDLSPQGKLDCLRKVDFKTLEESINVGAEETLGIQKVFRGTGVVDGDFIPDIPTELVDRGEYNHVDLMLGMTKDEGLLQTVNFEINPDLYGLAQVLWKHLGPMFLFGRVGDYDTWPGDWEKCQDITNFYLGSRWNIDQEHFQNLTDMISDAYIWYGTHNHAKWTAQHGDNVFQYLFQFKGPYGYLDSYGVDSTQYGVAHSDELWQLWNIYFGVYWMDRPEDIRRVSDAMLEMWISFASVGDPTPPGSSLETWAPVTPEDHRYLVIDSEMRMDASESYQTRMGVWDKIFEYPTGNTIPPSPELRMVKEKMVRETSDMWTGVRGPGEELS